jgi:hypothetical protein
MTMTRKAGRHDGPRIRARQNLTATLAPTASDDSAAGYGVGSQWLDAVGDKIWFCTDATTGAAVWRGVTIA